MSNDGAYMGEELRDFLRTVDASNLDALDIPVHLAGSEEWNTMDATERSPILGGMLRNLVERTKRHVPFYRKNWTNAPPPGMILDIDDLSALPLVSKDSVPGTGSLEKNGILGFRAALLADPNLLVPDNLEELIRRQEAANPGHRAIVNRYGGRKILEFSSGGSQGRGTITRLSYLAVEMEAYALVRALRMNGLQSGQSIACFYNDTHKGGLQLERAAQIMEMPFYSKRKIFEDLVIDSPYAKSVLGFQRLMAEGESELANERHGAEVRKGIREYIKSKRIQVVESVQPPTGYLANNQKGSALAFMTLYEGDPSAFDSVEHVFLTGFSVPKTAYETLRERGIAVSTTWGSSEAMALGTHAILAGDDVNNLIATPFPTVGGVFWYRERDGVQRLVPAPKGDEGILVVTSLIGAGSTYIQYRIGDKAICAEGGYRAIERSNINDIAGSCASDALGV
ncbi:hypothetical protein EXS74_01250 [Candidatus Woesearchaeota archaeon]|nr:hypothetical protein [Candidatus Woesearchaeota archaeon]